MFRIFQELLTNVTKHADAMQVFGNDTAVAFAGTRATLNSNVR